MTAGRWVEGSPLRATDFPPGTPLHHFFLWNERRWRPDRRYVVACDLYRLWTAFGGDDAAAAVAAAHLAGEPVVLARRGARLLVASAAAPAANRKGGPARPLALAAARYLTERLLSARGTADPAAHAAVFAAFESLAAETDLALLAAARPRPRRLAPRQAPRNILVIRLSALGDFIQSLGPAAAIRRHHAGDRVTLLTTAPFAEFALQLGLFDAVLIDRRPRPFALRGWLALRRNLRHGRFDRVYDLHTSQRSSAYRRLFLPAKPPEWSGIARGCSHPHANLGRDQQHTIDKQAEQLLMAGIFPTPLSLLPPFASELALPDALAGHEFALLVPGSSPRHPAKRWPAGCYGMLAQALLRRGLVPVVVGSAEEQALAAAIREACPQALDLTGRTGLALLAALAERAVVTIGNDTGVSHLAAAAGCPVVVLFSRASDPARCAPRGAIVRVMAVPDLADLAAERVIAAALEAAAAREPAAAGAVP